MMWGMCMCILSSETGHIRQVEDLIASLVHATYRKYSRSVLSNAAEHTHLISLSR
jgi:hypothetical protein